MIGTLGSICAQIAPKAVVVAIGQKEVKCNSFSNFTCLGFSWWRGSDYTGLFEGAKKDVAKIIHHQRQLLQNLVMATI